MTSSMTEVFLSSGLKESFTKAKIQSFLFIERIRLKEMTTVGGHQYRYNPLSLSLIELLD